jgi:hypothetical protein
VVVAASYAVEFEEVIGCAAEPSDTWTWAVKLPAPQEFCWRYVKVLDAATVYTALSTMLEPSYIVKSYVYGLVPPFALAVSVWYAPAFRDVEEASNPTEARSGLTVTVLPWEHALEDPESFTLKEYESELGTVLSGCKPAPLRTYTALFCTL